MAKNLKAQDESKSGSASVDHKVADIRVASAIAAPGGKDYSLGYPTPRRKLEMNTRSGRRIAKE